MVTYRHLNHIIIQGKKFGHSVIQEMLKFARPQEEYVSFTVPMISGLYIQGHLQFFPKVKKHLLCDCCSENRRLNKQALSKKSLHNLSYFVLFLQLKPFLLHFRFRFAYWSIVLAKWCLFSISKNFSCKQSVAVSR